MDFGVYKVRLANSDPHSIRYIAGVLLTTNQLKRRITSFNKLSYSRKTLLIVRECSSAFKVASIHSKSDFELERLSRFFNDLENAVLIKYPEINYIKNMLYKGGAFFSLMTGSGSAVFGLFKEHNEALHCLEQIKNRYYKIFLTKTLV
jgi:4-diphosphocytidyl-2C-methyl-D-erythritol kinase